MKSKVAGDVLGVVPNKRHGLIDTDLPPRHATSWVGRTQLQ